MKSILTIVLLTAACGLPAVAAKSGQEAQSAVAAQPVAGTSIPPQSLSETNRADLYDYFALGHLLEQQFEATGQYELADQSIEAYKKALAIEPDSSVIHERLAEVEAKSQHIKDAVLDAEAALKIDPKSVDAHRLLARIYIRTLGDMSAGEVQKDSIDKAIAQFQAILALQPSDSYSGLWLARLYRFENQHGEAEKVLRGILQHEPDNEQALEQLSQLLMDEGRSQEAVDLLSQAANDSSSPDLYDMLGQAQAQQKDWPKAEGAYRQAIQEEPDEPSHRQGLADALIAEGKYPRRPKTTCAWPRSTAGWASSIRRKAACCAPRNSRRATCRCFITRRCFMKIRANMARRSRS
jgi:tetratricopeptide (TPR) repeat protein